MLLLVLVAHTASAIQPAAAQDAPGSSTPSLVRIVAIQQGADVQVAWPPGADAERMLAEMPTVVFQGYELPMQLLTVRHDGADAPHIAIQQVTSTTWAGALTAAAPLSPPALPDPLTDDGARVFPLAHEASALPATPVFVLRAGMLHGQRTAVVAISPLFQADGQPRLVTNLAATIPNATLLTSPPSTWTGAVGVSAVQPATADNALLPTNPLAARSAFKVIVSQPGVQRLSGEALAAAGLNLASTDPATLQLRDRGAPVPLEIDGLVDGRLTTASTVRFIAHTAGDRWNLSSIYWLTTEAAGGARMTTRDVAPASAPPRATVIEEGVWLDNRIYDSFQPGVDGDHWFHRSLRSDASGAAAAATVAINNGLPPAAGASIYTLTMSARVPATFTVTVQMGDSHEIVQWAASPPNGQSIDWVQPMVNSAPVANLQIALADVASGFANASLWLDRILWSQPATLNLNQHGAWFRGVTGDWRYQWQAAPHDGQGRYRLYDVTDPLAPVALVGATSAGFEDGPAAHAYLLAGPGVEHEPAVQAHQRVIFTDAPGAEAIYIAPAQFIPALEPLLAHRRAQGYSATAVDVQQIYDAWSYGHASAEAIRTFLRFARSHWPQPPIAVVMVGDGTWDPHNYENRDHYTNFVPPYVARVDPWLGEAACENCYAQLDGDDPLTGDQLTGGPGAFFATDIWIGRFPVKSVAELDHVVDKLLRYESDTSPGAWRNVSLFLADNFIRRIDDEGNAVRDPVGDFARMSDLVIRRALCAQVGALPGCDFTGQNSELYVSPSALHEQIMQLLAHASLRIVRHYYDPHPEESEPTGVQPWRIPDARAAKEGALAAMSQGAAVVVYAGHANHWQWGTLDSWAPTQPGEVLPGFLNLFEPDGLANRDRLSIVLSMTCYTSQFHKPANSGTTLDERMFLANGGAVAVWGSSGLSVVHGHDALQRGFFEALWRAPHNMNKPIGALLEAGYLELLTTNACCQDAAQTFLLLGDPLTPARVLPLDLVHLPLVSN